MKGADMEKICLNCEYAELALADVDIWEALGVEDYLFCTHSFNVVNARNLNNDSGHNLKIEAFKVDDYDTCAMWKKSKGRENDLKCGC